MEQTVFLDDPSYSLYTRASGEATKPHKKVRVETDGCAQQEIADFPDTVIGKGLCQPTKLIRYYFLSTEEWHAARRVTSGG